mgnify:CR=1 FL=1
MDWTGAAISLGVSAVKHFAFGGGKGGSGGGGGYDPYRAREAHQSNLSWARDRVRGNVGRAEQTSFVPPTRVPNAQDDQESEGYIRALIQNAANTALSSPEQQAAFKEALQYTVNPKNYELERNVYGDWPEAHKPDVMQIT